MMSAALHPNDLRVARIALEEGRPGAWWFDLFRRREGHALMARALGLRFPCPARHDEVAAHLALSEIGVTAERIVKCGPLWRAAMPSEMEAGEDALILPVGRGSMNMVDGQEHCLSLLGLHDHVAMDWVSDIADLIAIPLSGGKAMSFTGLTAAVGNFVVDESGQCTLVASGLAFLKRHVNRARVAAKEMPAHLVARTLPFPDRVETLLLEPDHFEWRMPEADCVVPQSAAHIACVDSPGLARFVDDAMKKRVAVRKAPPVLAPKVGMV